ncbi:hypothetical protein EVAR_75585_1 [Eumeta japonica]|uniref:DUF5641 domain-containing protein n=1 Tax=Eumeta variegata TaxID=151549 RepID=A0A4C1TZV0_EUMVA|nr:hypothetical protein EVAR_75585_1 [Eumeta japonica]
MYSDNGTNFVGANKELMNIQEVHEKMKKEADVRTITGSSYLPALRTWVAPGSVGAICQNRVGRYIERGALAKKFSTPYCWKPSTSSTPDPGHFDDNVLLGPANWRTCQRLADHFWQRWLREYLPTLVPRRARGDPICRAPAEGDIVLIVDSSSPRYSWPRGRIKKTYPGPDNQVRVVDVETTGGVLRRPTSKIVVLVSAEATAVPCPEV